MFSFGDIARQEATRISEALDAVQDLLHQPQIIEVTKDNAESAVVTEGDISDEGDDGFAGFHHYRRYESAGYDAHSDCVDAAEVSSWQGAFPYFRIVGRGMPSPQPASSSSKATTQDIDDMVEFIPAAAESNPSIQSPNTVEMSVVVDPEVTPGWCDLIVEGRKMVIGQGPPPGLIVDEEDVQGVLEELICIDVGSTDDASNRRNSDDDRPLSPSSSQQEEVMAILMDVVWPEVVDALLPLVREVVKLSRERGIVYESEPDEPVADGGGGGWVESDDEF